MARHGLPRFDDLIPFPEAPKVIGKFLRRKRFSLSTLHRWRLQGMPTTKIGGMRFVTIQGVLDFATRCSAEAV